MDIKTRIFTTIPSGSCSVPTDNFRNLHHRDGQFHLELRTLFPPGNACTEHIRKHPVKPPELGIVTFVSCNSNPFVASVLIPNNNAAIISKAKSAFPANKTVTKKFTALE